MMECIENNRVAQFAELKKFIESTDKHLNEWLSCLGWNEDSIKNIRPPLICPFNSSHHISEKNLEQHLEKCQWRAEGYGESDLPLSTPSASSKAPYCITFDEQLQEDVFQQAKLKNPSMKMGLGGRLIPRTSDRFIADFTTDERRVLYDYVIANTIQPDIGDDIANLNKPLKSNENKTSSYLELLAQERNLKRRRAKHRGIHTNKKSQIEINRELINQQMEILAEYIAEKIDHVKSETRGYSSSLSRELKEKNIPEYEKKSSLQQNYYDFEKNHDYNKRSRSTEINHVDLKAASEKSPGENRHSKIRKKSSREHSHHRSRQSSDEKYKKKHKRRHSKHRRHDRTNRHHSKEHKSLKHSKKSKYTVKE